MITFQQVKHRGGRGAIFHFLVISPHHWGAVFDNQSMDFKVPGQRDPISISLWDTAGQDEYSRIRTLAYPGTDVFLVCFSVASEQTFENVPLKWIPEIKHHSPGVPIVVVGMQTDIVNRAVSTERGREIAKRVGAADYVECSSREGSNVQAVMQAAVSATIAESAASKQKQQPRCHIL